MPETLPASVPPVQTPQRPPASEPMTFESFLARGDDRKADLIDGYLSFDVPTDAHEDLFLFLASVLRSYAEERELGVVRGSRTPVPTGRRGGLEPDIVFVQAARIGIIARDHLSAAPDVVVEIVSPSSVSKDYTTKRAAYEELGVREYWLIDPVNAAARFFRLGSDGAFADVTPAAGAPFESEAVAGFRVDPGVLLRGGLPRVRAFVDGLLGTDR